MITQSSRSAYWQLVTQIIKHPCSWHRYHTTPNRTGVFQNTSCIVPVKRRREHISSTCAVTRMSECAGLLQCFKLRSVKCMSTQKCLYTVLQYYKAQST